MSNIFITGQVPTLLQRIQVVTSTPAIPLANTTYYTSAQTSLTFSGLTGDSYRYMFMCGKIVSAGNDSTTINFNGVSSSVYDYRVTQPNDGTSNNVYTGSAQTFIQIGISTGSNTIDTFQWFMLSASGQNRQIVGQYLRGAASGNGISAGYDNFGVWRNSANEITSVTLGYASQSNGFKIGTEIMLYGLI